MSGAPNFFTKNGISGIMMLKPRMSMKVMPRIGSSRSSTSAARRAGARRARSARTPGSGGRHGRRRRVGPRVEAEARDRDVARAAEVAFSRTKRRSRAAGRRFARRDAAEQLAHRRDDVRPEPFAGSSGAASSASADAALRSRRRRTAHGAPRSVARRRRSAGGRGSRPPCTVRRTSPPGRSPRVLGDHWQRPARRATCRPC